MKEHLQKLCIPCIIYVLIIPLNVKQAIWSAGTLLMPIFIYALYWLFIGIDLSLLK